MTGIDGERLEILWLIASLLCLTSGLLRHLSAAQHSGLAPLTALFSLDTKQAFACIVCFHRSLYQIWSKSGHGSGPRACIGVWAVASNHCGCPI